MTPFVFLHLCSGLCPGPGRPAAPPVGPASRVVRSSVGCCSPSPRPRWTFQKRSVARTNHSSRGPATTAHAARCRASLWAWSSTALVPPGLRTSTAGATGATKPAQPRVLLVSSLHWMKVTLSLSLSVLTHCACHVSIPGKQKAIVKCVNKRLGEEVEDSLCESSRQPPVMIRVCNPEPCPPRWEARVADWLLMHTLQIQEWIVNNFSI